MLSSQEDPVKARIIEAELALDVVADLLERSPADLKKGTRSKGEAFISNTPPLWGYDRDTERLFLALDIAVSAVQADPTFGGGYALAAACLYRMGMRDTDVYDPRSLIAAIPWANRAIQIDPAFEAGWETYIEIHCYKGDFKTGETALGKVYRRFGDNDLYARCAFLFFRLQGDVPQAKNWGALAWQTEWDSARLVRTLFALGQLYREGKETAKALDCYRVITEKDHDNAWAWHYFAHCTAALGDPQRATELNQRAIDLGTEHEFRTFQEHLRKQSGRRRLGSSTTVPVLRAKPPGKRPSSGIHAKTVPASSTRTTSVRAAPTPLPARKAPKTMPTPPAMPAIGSGRRTVPTPPMFPALPPKKSDTSKEVRMPSHKRKGR